MADEVASGDWVTMLHPDIEGTARVTKEAFDSVWSEKGWVIASEASAPATPTSAPAAPAE